MSERRPSADRPRGRRRRATAKPEASAERAPSRAARAGARSGAVEEPRRAGRARRGRARRPDGSTCSRASPTDAPRGRDRRQPLQRRDHDKLLEAALAELDEPASPRRDHVMPVPGAFELPLAAMALAKTRRFACIVALGCVIRGETPHFDFVAGEAACGLQLAALETGVPVAFGVLTLDRPSRPRPGGGALEQGRRGRAHRARDGRPLRAAARRGRSVTGSRLHCRGRCPRSAQSAGRSPSFGNNRSHSMVATKRRFNPNLQRVRVLVNGRRAGLRLHPLPEGGPRPRRRSSARARCARRARGEPRAHRRPQRLPGPRRGHGHEHDPDRARGRRRARATTPDADVGGPRRRSWARAELRRDPLAARRAGRCGRRRRRGRSMRAALARSLARGERRRLSRPCGIRRRARC